MKRFALTIVTTIIIAACILVCFTLYDVTRFMRINYKLPDKIHIIVMGPSTTACAINDELIDGVKNLSKSGGRLMTLPLLERILISNPQIDTVWINYGRFYYAYLNQNNKNLNDITEVKFELPLYLIDHDNISWIDMISNKEFYLAIISPDFRNIATNNDSSIDALWVGYEKLDINNLFNNSASFSINWYNNHCQDIDYNLNNNEYTKELNAINNAINVCKEHSVTPVLFFTPLYQYNRWCQWSNIKEYVNDIDTTTLIADYEDFQFPDSSFYGDVHHINYKGAEYLSTHINNHGLNVLPIQDWKKQYGIDNTYQ